jgi:GTP cyclohydrolase II
MNNLNFVASAKLPTIYGEFTIYGFQDRRNNKEHVAIVAGDIAGKSALPVRVHSECLTGEVFGSLRCDCREQLQKSLEYIGQQQFGLLIYLRQEGRDIGLNNKIKAYHLQDQGLDTFEANLQLGLPADAREFDLATEILEYFRIGSVKIMTNNPEKIEQLEKVGIEITERIKIPSSVNQHNHAYLKAKKEKMGHLL